MMVFVVIPEFLVGLALQDRIMARESHKKMKDRYIDAEEWWTRTHAFYANMGGFVLRDTTKEKSEYIDAEEMMQVLDIISTIQRSKQEKSRVTTDHNENPNEEHSDAEKMINVPDGFIDTPPSKQDIQDKSRIATDHSEGPNEEYTDAEKNIKMHVPDGFIETLPSEEEIHDKSKGDYFVKGTAVIQVLWLFIQVTIRHLKGLPTSQLEISVLAFSVCAIITYFLSWEKPQGVMTPTYITAVDIGRRLNSPHPWAPNPDMLTRTRWLQAIFLLRRSRQEVDRSRPIPYDMEYVFLRKTDPFSYVDIGATACGSISGGFHFLAWDYPFPTLTEKLLWRAATLFLTVFPSFFLLAVLCMWRLDSRRWIDTIECQGPRHDIAVVTALVPNLLYVAARLCIVVESLRALFFLPPEAFIATTWSTQMPHVS
jgi:hypothetical protein